MHDTVIRGGTIVDGTGQKAFTGDIAIDGDRIAEVGGKAGPAKRDINADGMLVTPGWVDVHTHYDGQATWDKELAPSSWHGVTTILFGNCGVGFAPVRREHHASLIGLMEAVEEIPGITLSEGLKWDWESFPQYLDTLDRMPRSIDVAAQVPQPVLGLDDGRDVPARYPPRHGVQVRQPLEPLPAAAQHLAVRVAEHERGERLDRLPHRHVDQDPGASSRVPLERADRGGVAVLGLQPPDEARRRIGQRVDGLQPGHEVSQHRAVQRGLQPPDVDLRKVVVHNSILPAAAA